MTTASLNNRVLLAALFFVAAACSNSQADLVQYNFEISIDSASTTFLGISMGGITSVSGTLIYDTDAVPTSPPGKANWQNMAGASLVLNMGGNTVTGVAGELDAGTHDSDKSVSFGYGKDETLLVNGTSQTDLGVMGLFFQSAVGPAGYADGSLDFSLVPLSTWDIEASFSAEDGVTFVNGTITSLSAVAIPEPSSLTLLCLASGGFSVMSRRRRSRTA